MTAFKHAADSDHPWWSSLNHGGLLIAPARLTEHLGEAPEPLPKKLEERLRRDITRVKEDEKHLGALLDTVFADILGLGVMAKESSIDKRWSHKLLTGESYRPNRLWLGSFGDVFPIFVVRARGESTPRLGIGRGRREVSKVIEWLRLAEQKVGLLTNGRQFRLIHAGADYDAWCEWDTELWFEEGRPGLQVEALRRLLGVDALKAPAEGAHPKLVEAILASRRGQAQLSAALGERVRLAVETLIRASAQVIDPLLHGEKPQAAPADVYIAATRIVMRLVVVLFAEARELLPRDNPLYHGSYGLQGLREELDRAAGGRAERLRHRFSSWPRLLGLFRLVANGSGHEELPIPAYGGGLFEAGKSNSNDAVSRALAAFESADNNITDDTIRTILEYLTRSPVKVRQGRSFTTVTQPVDFSDLSSEYIGILYEGLLDFELRRVPDEDTFVFLNVGDEPALPMSRLEKMTEKELKSLFEKLKTKSQADDGESDEEGAEKDEQGEASQNEETDSDSDAEAVPLQSDAHREARQRADKWSKKAVFAAGLVKTRKGKEPDASDVEAAQKKLVRRVLSSGEWFLVRWGGTRKGAGTFYTRPQLAGPTTRRTLQPLAYDIVKEAKDERTGLMEAVEWAPKKPEEILALKVCDPSMGSGSFLVSALRFLSQALMESLFHHGRLESKDDDRTLCRLADGAVAGHPKEELLPVPKDHPEFGDRLRARLKHHVVEACIYGVDLDPVAVELARLALWIETMDRSLPFEFLDHRLKVGNALAGCWFDRFQDYPLAAWEREGGDKAHTRFVYHFREEVSTRGKNKGKAEKKGDPWTHAIAQFAAEKVYPELAELIRSQFQPSFGFGQEKSSAPAVHEDARKALEQMRRLAVHEAERRADLYATRVRDNEAVKQMRRQFDAWCAVWFWPGDRINEAPRPMTLHALPENVAAIVDEVAREHRFFHWELEFADVFTHEGSGFDAIIGNPPWDAQKPNSKEFFSNFDPLYRTYGKQEALNVQEKLFAEAPEVEQQWIRYQGRFKALANWVKHSGQPFGDPTATGDGGGLPLSRGDDNAHLHATWRQLRKQRKGYADPTHPYVHQGSADLNTYKMFLETAHALLRTGGQLGFIVPSGLYTDKGSTELRDLFLNECRWQWLFGFENRDGIFDIHRSFKFAPVIVQKGGRTEAIRAAFMRRDPQDWEIHQPVYLSLGVELVRRASPTALSIPEVTSQEAIAVLDRIYRDTVPLGSEAEGSWKVTSSRELHMTDDSRLLHDTSKLEDDGWSRDPLGFYSKGSDLALPLLQGTQVSAFNTWSKRWLSGSGTQAKWEETATGTPDWRPQLCVKLADCLATDKVKKQFKIVYRRISQTTNSRTFMCTVTEALPTGDSVFCLFGGVSLSQLLALASCLNSFVFDWQLRDRMGGTNVSWFFLENIALPKPERCLESRLDEFALRMTAHSNADAHLWARWLDENPHRKDIRSQSWSRLRAVTQHERLRLACMIDAVVAHLSGLESAQLRWILRDCEQTGDWSTVAARNPKGFWRVHKDREPQLRQPILTLAALADLEAKGLREFLQQNDGDGWYLPESLRLSEPHITDGAGKDEAVPVAERLGSRFEAWQLESTPAESWRDCRQLAERIRAHLQVKGKGVDAAAGVPQAPETAQREMFGHLAAASSRTSRRR